MAESNIFVGAGAGVIGLLVGYLAGGPNTDDLVEQVTSQVSSSAAAASAAGAEQMKAMEGKLSASAEQVAAMDTKIAGLEKALAASQEGMGSKLDEAVKSLSARMDTMTSDIGKTVTDSGSAQTEKVQTALNAGIEKLQGSISQIALAPAAAAAAGDDTSTDAAAAPAPVEIDGVRVGQTELLMDGAVRVFVSSVNQDDKTARVAVNGQTMQMVGSYHDGDFMLGEKACTLMLDDIVQGHVQMSANCEE